jgi:hypothetical protein
MGEEGVLMIAVSDMRCRIVQSIRDLSGIPMLGRAR